MNRLERNIQVVQNIGLADRLIRFFGGGALLSWGSLSLVLGSTPVLATVAILLAVYPLMTTVMGWDPMYQLFGTRTCSLEGGRNQCGTFPYEMDAAIGHDPQPDTSYEHSLTSSRHVTKLKSAA